MSEKEKNPIEEALEKRDEQDYQAYCLLKSLYRSIDYVPGLKNFIAIVDEFGLDGTDMVEEMKEIIAAREAANEEFMQSIKNAYYKQ